MGQGEYLGKHITLRGRKFGIYKSIAPKVGRYDAMNFFAAAEDDSTAEDISFTFGIGEAIARGRRLTNQETLIKFLTPLGLRHFYLILEDAEYGSHHKKILGPTSPPEDFDPDDSVYIYFSSQEWDQMFVNAQKSPDDNVRKEIYEKIQQMWTDEVPTAPIFQGTLYIFAQNDIDGIMISPTLQFIYSAISKGK